MFEKRRYKKELLYDINALIRVAELKEDEERFLEVLEGLKQEYRGDFKVCKRISRIIGDSEKKVGSLV